METTSAPANAPQNPNPNTVDASPTKEFFIDILTRDINLLDAVKDLVDNSVDGARRLRPTGDLSGLSVDISLTKDHFLIVDNCGGISVKLARDYAFRFGRAPSAPVTDGSIGRFGVGMKRALFKLGKYFSISSKSTDSSFRLEVDVDEWKRKRDEKGHELWQFEFKEMQENEINPEDSTSTTLEVTGLHPAIASEFDGQSFKNGLIDAIQHAHEQSMERGLAISVNDFELKHQLSQLLRSNEIRPIKLEAIFPGDPGGGESRSDVKLTLFAGIGETQPSDAGWSVVCNGRQVLRADKTEVTGWHTVVDGVRIPRAHNQFSRFRGFVFFDSLDADGLPWNTAKSGIDAESPAYRWARGEMIAAMRQVIDFLNKVDAEKDTESTAYEDAIARSVNVRLKDIVPSKNFVYPDVEKSSEIPRETRVSFVQPNEDVQFAKDFFRVTSARSAGKEAFGYFLERERE